MKWFNKSLDNKSGHTTSNRWLKYGGCSSVPFLFCSLLSAGENCCGACSTVILIHSQRNFLCENMLWIRRQHQYCHYHNKPAKTKQHFANRSPRRRRKCAFPVAVQTLKTPREKTQLCCQDIECSLSLLMSYSITALPRAIFALNKHRLYSVFLALTFSVHPLQHFKSCPSVLFMTWLTCRTR